MRNEITDLLLEELERHGLVGEIGERGKHLEVAYHGPHGRRFVVAARTPSDWRAAMNTRSDLRKLLRKDGLQPLPDPPKNKKNVLSFSHAMSLPQAPTSPDARSKVVAADIEVLIDLVFELQKQIGLMSEKLEKISVVSTVTSTISSTLVPVEQESPVISFQKAAEVFKGTAPPPQPEFELTEPEPRELTRKRGATKRPAHVQWVPRKGSKQRLVLDLLSSKPEHMCDIAKVAELSVKHVGNILWALMKHGLAERVSKGTYKKK